MSVRESLVSAYTIRKAHKKGQCSTLEAPCAALAQFVPTDLTYATVTNTVSVTVVAAPPTTTLIATPPDASGNLAIGGATAPGTTVNLWWSTNLGDAGGGWMPARTTNADGSGAYSFPIIIGTNPKAFYKVK